MKPFRPTALILATAFGLLIQLGSALAQESASPSTSSDFSGKAIDLDFKPGKIDTSDGRFSVGGGMVRDSKGGSGYGAELEVRRRLFVAPSYDDTFHDSRTVGAPLTIDPALKARIEGKDKNDISRVSVQGAEVRLLYGQTLESHSRYTAPSDGKPVPQDLLNEWATLQASKPVPMTIQRRDELEDCAFYRNHVDHCKELGLEDSDKAKAQLDLERLAASSNYSKDATGLAAFERKLADQGFMLFDGRIVERPAATSSRLKADQEVGGTLDGSVGAANGIYEKDNVSGITRYGAMVRGPEGSFHSAFRINGVNLDVCGQLTTIAAVLGRVSGREAIFESSAGACLGVKLGPAGHLQGKASYTTDWTSYQQAAFDAELKKIGGLPISIGYSHQIEKLPNNDIITRDLVTGKLTIE